MVFGRRSEAVSASWLTGGVEEGIYYRPSATRHGNMHLLDE